MKIKSALLGMGTLGCFAALAIAATAATAPTSTPDSTIPNPNAAPNAPGTPPPASAAGPGGVVAPATDFWKRDTLFGDLGGARSTLGDHGIAIAPVYTGEVMGNLTGGAGGYDTASQRGGVGHGVIYEHSLNVPIDIDLCRAVPGWQGATLHANALWIAGPGLSPSYVGDIGDTSNIQGYNTVRLQELWYQQNFLSDKISLKIGQIAADSEFFISSTACLFLNGTFGTFTLVGSNLPDPQDPPLYPMAAPGFRLRLQPIDDFYFQAGIFDGNTESQSANPNGTDFHLNSESGALVLSEVGYLLNQASGQSDLQGTYKFGAFVHTHNFNSWTSRAAGTPASSGSDYGLYAVIDQQLYSEGGRCISFFTRGGYAPAEVNAVTWYVDGGFNFTGFIPGRANDVAGIAVARSKFSGDYSDAQVTLNGTHPTSAETVIEGTYKIQLAPWWTLQPDFQYIFTPSGVDGSHDAAVLGVRTSVIF